MKKISREDELKILAESRKLVQSEGVDKELGDWFDKNISERDKLEQMGSHWDAFGLFPNAKPGDVQRDPSAKIDPDLVAMLIAGMIRCFPTSCEHVRGKLGIVRYVFLAPRICSCEPCVITFQKHFAEHDAKREHAGECDLCLTQGLTVFHPVKVAYNGALFFGDFCPSCKILAVGK